MGLTSGCILDRSGTRPGGADGGADGGTCPGVDLLSDPMHCGACDRACPRVVTGTARCAMGACVVDCAPGRGDCDGDPATGCEVDLGLDRDHCGACGASCDAVGPNQLPGACRAGVCQPRCAEGFADCDGDPATGCEAHLATERANCGACGRACPLPPNGQPLCEAGACRVRCDDARFLDCNGDPADGCEIDGRDAFRCGLCPDAPEASVCGTVDFCVCDPMAGCRCQFF